jgi:hypothetical protein
VSDARLSTLRRAALTGDLSSRVAYLSEWLRSDPACETCGGRGQTPLPSRGTTAFHSVRRDLEALDRIQQGQPVALNAEGRVVPADDMLDALGYAVAMVPQDRPVEISLPLADRRHDWSAVPRQAWRTSTPCSVCHGTGTQRRSRVELLAYCGDEAAQAVLGSSWRSEAAGGSQAAAAGLAVYRDGPGSRAAFEGWARGLSRWGRETATRAAVAASRAALDHAQRRDHRDWDWADVLDRARVCVEAGEAWLSCPCDEHLEAWRRAWAVFPPPPQWAPAPDVEGWTLSTAGRQAPCALVDVTAPAAAQASSESSVRSAIQRSLTEWALSPPGP